MDLDPRYAATAEQLRQQLDQRAIEILRRQLLEEDRLSAAELEAMDAHWMAWTQASGMLRGVRSAAQMSKAAGHVRAAAQPWSPTCGHSREHVRIRNAELEAVAAMILDASTVAGVLLPC